MTGIWILILLILISSLPILAAFTWLRLIRFPLNIRWFFGSLAAGAAALILAGFLQSLFPSSAGAGMGMLLFKLFVQVAMTEELGRLVFILFFLWFYRRFLLNVFPNTEPEPFSDTVSFDAATGFLAGLGFAVIETAAYGAANPGSALLRVFIAAPLHGACGCRVGLTAAYLRDSPLRALMFFVYAVAIHGMYNFMVITPGLPSVFPIVLVFAALLSAFRVMRRG